MLSFLNSLIGVHMTNQFPDIDSLRWNAYFNAAKAMETSGSFAGAIAEAYYAADKRNKAKLEQAFQDLFFAHMSDYDRAWFGK
jgi:hypothetical protein